jgi:1-acyl-sn-glycerol-3-phosphate acyltransferase
MMSASTTLDLGGGSGNSKAPLPLRPIAHRMHLAVEDDSVKRDVGTIRRWRRVLDAYTALFSPDVRGVDNVPVTGPALAVGNHSLYWMAEVWAAARAVSDRRGENAPVRGLAYDLLFAIPWFGNELRRLGIVPARPDAGETALARGELVMVYPGGDLDACRSWSERDRIELGGRHGFVRLALRSGVPVVPVVAHGSTHGVVVVSRGDQLARWMHLPMLRIKVFPIFAGPLGITPVLLPPPPLPTAIDVEFQRPLDWSRYGPEAADDPDVVRDCYDETVAVMQAGMDRLAAEHPHPVTSGAVRLLTAPWRALRNEIGAR